MESRDNPRLQQDEIDDQFGLNKITHFKIEDFLKPFEAQMATLKLGSLKPNSEGEDATPIGATSDAPKNMLSGLDFGVKRITNAGGGALAPNKPLMLGRFDLEATSGEPGKFSNIPDLTFDKNLLDELEPYTRETKDENEKFD